MDAGRDEAEPKEMKHTTSFIQPPKGLKLDDAAELHALTKDEMSEVAQKLERIAKDQEDDEKEQK
eukprot:CAMPEP_0113941824 /NCGR_PEP_ID=MMETSP1339-20121228/7659_1 /TAXON_ID=94617 /ORGANISM="Fibrocapsa japonica" /LENGTH=64 /DNA_ID=CAMNT_0000946075 /DNA_START=119 /DNA_END=313 /DNA_ORIENTATION=+ /assembly_acc=CAM_ASM_000762